MLNETGCMGAVEGAIRQLRAVSGSLRAWVIARILPLAAPNSQAASTGKTQ